MKRKMLVFTHKNHVYIYLGGCPFYTIEGFQERGFFFFKKQNQEMSFFFFFWSYRTDACPFFNNNSNIKLI